MITTRGLLISRGVVDYKPSLGGGDIDTSSDEGDHRNGRTDRQTDGQTDGRTLPSTLSPHFAVDKNHTRQLRLLLLRHIICNEGEVLSLKGSRFVIGSTLTWGS